MCSLFVCVCVSAKRPCSPRRHDGTFSPGSAERQRRRIGGPVFRRRWNSNSMVTPGHDLAPGWRVKVRGQRERESVSLPPPQKKHTERLVLFDAGPCLHTASVGGGRRRPDGTGKNVPHTRSFKRRQHCRCRSHTVRADRKKEGERERVGDEYGGDGSLLLLAQRSVSAMPLDCASEAPRNWPSWETACCIICRRAPLPRTIFTTTEEGRSSN